MVGYASARILRGGGFGISVFRQRHDELDCFGSATTGRAFASCVLALTFRLRKPGLVVLSHCRNRLGGEQRLFYETDL